ncbi:DUF3055 domain-containing protein [Paenibacillus alvei]|uniref:DUF3055 domain-containing protein n=1 Tax=Paenibacillus alvei TaxID=44250 RepID=UPI000287AC02|nr:DUF3055 domain-containing protein [Paenibacillus alvei]EJW17466.1 hypothetical protein PAV_4c05770 [Paenibacillus alvei DSM 29]MCY7487078.1 DUF3055 domain-containing protein [Paenibacillus alvei]MCY9540342.1 DUF3055 domain-containing protein [Paenibacillus alvei]MCY9705889.1 DUF3055 domain-containing protein [Paenibacillus alvei]MCY9737028.1 DUF3055 domain-containing protein [Paenibacillus alvei]
MFDDLYEVTEQANVTFVGWATEQIRFDFALIYSDHFYGKTLVVCMQTGRSTLLCADDLRSEILQAKFDLPHKEAAYEAAQLLRTRIPSLEVQDQY